MPGWGRVFICVKNNIAFPELRVDDKFEIIAVDVKGSDRQCTWERVSIYSVTNQDVGCVNTNRAEWSPIQSSHTLESRGVHTDRVESSQVCGSRSGFLVPLDEFLFKLIFLILLLYMLTALGLTAGGSSTVQTYTQKIHRTTK